MNGYREALREICPACDPRPMTHCSCCGRRLRERRTWSWLGHAWDCVRIGKEPNCRAEREANTR